MGEHDRKRELIIESAMKRFSHYGIQKTTMNDIADDISVTQASLYYYFPDKTSLIVAVVKKIATDYCITLENMLKGISCLKDAFYQIIVIRKAFIERYFMLHLTDSAAEATIRENCAEVMEDASQTEIELVGRQIEEAVVNGSLSEVDPKKMARLYLDTLTGLSILVLSKSPNKITLEKGELELIAERQTELTDIFLKGLKYKNTVKDECNKQEA